MVPGTIDIYKSREGINSLKREGRRRRIDQYRRDEYTDSTYFGWEIEKNHSSIEWNGQYYHSDFENLIDQIRDSQKLLEYEKNWDDENALPTDAETLKRAETFLLCYAKEIHKKFECKILKTPYIDITPNGSITIDWNLENASFLIIFSKENTQRAFFYGVDRIKDLNYKSGIDLTDDAIDSSLLPWMHKNLT
jgi:hypothetical protein